VEEIGDALRRVKTNKSRMFVKDFNAPFLNDVVVWKGAIGQRGNADVNGEVLLQLCCNNALYIMNTFFQQRDVHKPPDAGIPWVIGQ